MMTAPSSGPAGTCWAGGDLAGALTRAAAGVPCELAGIELDLTAIAVRGATGHRREPPIIGKEADGI